MLDADYIEFTDLVRVRRRARRGRDCLAGLLGQAAEPANQVVHGSGRKKGGEKEEERLIFEPGPGCMNIT